MFKTSKVKAEFGLLILAGNHCARSSCTRGCGAPGQPQNQMVMVCCPEVSNISKSTDFATGAAQSAPSWPSWISSPSFCRVSSEKYEPFQRCESSISNYLYTRKYINIPGADAKARGNGAELHIQGIEGYLRNINCI